MCMASIQSLRSFSWQISHNLEGRTKQYEESILYYVIESRQLYMIKLPMIRERVNHLFRTLKFQDLRTR